MDYISITDYEVRMKNIAVQLYSVRELLAADFEGTLRKLVEMGYQAIETASIPPTVSPAAAGKLFRELGLKVVSAHARLPAGENRERMIADVAAYGSPIYLVPGMGANAFDTAESTHQVCEQLNEAAAACRKAGLGLGYHNHTKEMADFGGKRAYQIMNAELDPAILFEVDTYWAKVAALDPAAVVAELGQRTRLLHFKDGPGIRDAPDQPLGTGMMNFPAVLKAAHYLETAIVEFDFSAGDILADLKQSIDYLHDLLL
jgi:sugar phosphate isomerase/epimerase